MTAVGILNLKKRYKKTAHQCMKCGFLVYANFIGAPKGFYLGGLDPFCDFEAEDGVDAGAEETLLELC